MHSAYITIATVLALLGASCGDDAGGLVEKRRDAELSARRARAAAPPEPQSDDLVLTAPPSRDGTEGAPTAELVFARAQQAIDAGNWIDLLHSIRPTTRAQWLRDLVVALAVVSTDDGTDHDVPSQRAKRSIRELLVRYGAYGTVRDDLSAEGVGRALVEKVKDPDGLYAALLEFATLNRAPLDPVRALQRIPRDARVSARPDPTAASLVRLVDRVRSPHQIGPVDADAGGQALTTLPDAGPTDGAFLPVRFFTQDGVTWLDES